MAEAEPRLFVDGDACPVKDEVETVASRLGCQVMLVTNGGIRPSINPLVQMIYVASGLDVADRWIVDNVCSGDLVITADMPLAAAVISKGARVVKPNGELLHGDNIGPALATRNLMTELRSADPFRQGGGRPFSKADRSQFMMSLDRELRATLKKTRRIN